MKYFVGLVLTVSLVFTGVICILHGTGDEQESSDSYGLPVQIIDTDELSYDGPYIDVVSELENRKPLDDSQLRITKVDMDTGLAAASSMSICDDAGDTVWVTVLLRVPMDDGDYQLIFRENKLVGYFPPDATFEEQFNQEMHSDRDTMLKLMDVYKGYVQEFLSEVR